MDADDAAELALLPNQCKFQLDVGSQGTIVHVSSRGSVHCEFVVPLQGIDVLFETKVPMRFFDACFDRVPWVLARADVARHMLMEMRRARLFPDEWRRPTTTASRKNIMLPIMEADGTSVIFFGDGYPK